MRLFRILRDRLKGTCDHDRVAGEIADELRHHEDLIAERLIREGRSPADARREAQRRIGNRARLQDAGYDVRGGGRLEAFVQDLRYGARRLVAAPAFALIAIVTLALGIGANTAIFSVATGILLRPLPYPAADRLAMVWMDNARINVREDWHSYPNYVDYNTRNATFDGMAAFNRRYMTLTGSDEPERLLGAHSSASLFDVLGVRPLLGRTYSREEDQAGAMVVVLSHRLWQQRFGASPDIVGHTIVLNGASREVIGVMPQGFGFPSVETQLWVPSPASKEMRERRSVIWVQVIGRMKPDVTLAQAQSDLERINADILRAFPDQKGYGVIVQDYREQIVGRIKPVLLALVAAVGFVLLIACTNVANLLLARASTREREVALRAALGAGHGRIIRQLLTESLLLAVLGGTAGLALGWIGVSAFVAAAPENLPRLTDIAVDGRVLAFTTAVALLTGILFGLGPALQMARTDPVHTLKEGGRGATNLARTLCRGLVVIEVALAVVLLVGAGLMIRSLARMQQLDIGLRTDHVLAARVSLTSDRYREDAAAVEAVRRLVERAAALPGVTSAATIGTVFLSATPNSTNFSIEGRPEFKPEERVEIPVDSITPDYFRVLQIPLRAGRFFDQRDAAGSTRAVIVNETMARMFWPDENPIGRRIKYGLLSSRGEWMTIVGVVADTHRTGYEAAVRPETYLPQAQSPDVGLALLIRTTGDPMALVPSLRAVLHEIDPLLPLESVHPLDDEVADMTAGRRLNTTLFAVFAAIAAILAAIGIYGVIAASVEHRTRELGVRLALGATGGGILRLVLVEGLWLVGVGLALGLAASLALSGAMARLLYEVRPTDAATLTSIAALTLIVALVASLIPAVRAVRVDPVTALRAE
jgi:putative ABC transport system permease protein